MEIAEMHLSDEVSEKEGLSQRPDAEECLAKGVIQGKFCFKVYDSEFVLEKALLPNHT